MQASARAMAKGMEIASEKVRATASEKVREQFQLRTSSLVRIQTSSGEPLNVSTLPQPNGLADAQGTCIALEYHVKNVKKKLKKNVKM